MVGKAGFLDAFFQLGEDHLCPLDDLVRHPRKLCHLDAVAVVRAATEDFPQEDNVVPPLFHGDIVVHHPVVLVFQFRQFVVMGGEEGFGMDFLFLQDVFNHRFGDAHAVEGGGAPADLVQQHQAVGGGVLENIGHLAHFHHKGGLAGG